MGYTRNMHLPDEREIYEFSIAPSYTIVQLVAAAGIPVIAWILIKLFQLLLILPADLTGGAVAAIYAVAFAISLYLALAALYIRLARHYYLTTDRVIAITGWLAQTTVSVDYPTITDLTVTQDVFERFITRSGTIEVDTAGSPGEEIAFIHVANPHGVRDQILELSEKAKQLLARYGHEGIVRSISVAPNSAAFPIQTNPAVIDANSDGVIDTPTAQSKPIEPTWTFDAADLNAPAPHHDADVTPLEPIDPSQHNLHD